MNLSNLIDIELDGINYSDYPDYVDAFITSATWKDTLEELTDDELDDLNENHRDFVYECVIDRIY